MSEELLENLVQLFAIIAGVDGKKEEERRVVEEFLNSQLNVERSSKYLQLFDDFSLQSKEQKLKRASNAGNEKPRVTVKDSSRMILICSQINQELTQQQKLSLTFSLFSLIKADGEISELEYEFLTTVADIFNISQEEFALIELFVNGAEPEDYYGDQTLIISADTTHANGHKQKHILVPKMPGFLVVLRLPSVEMYVVRYHGNHDFYVNNLHISDTEVQVLSTGNAIRSTRFDPIYYSDVINKFMRFKGGPRVVLHANNISYRFPNGNIGLHEFDFCEESGRLVGLLGPSGAGKSTMLELLNGNKKPEKGSVMINGIDIHKNEGEVEGLIGYVPQDDLLIEELTVFENLFFAARLSFGDLKRDELVELVDKVLVNLGISHIADNKVGNPLQKIISGGERKRVNMGLELLREPAILFIDEPTSGLSSSDSYNIMDLLKELTLKGKLVFVVIHQPSSDIFKMFDKIIMLDSGGYPIYYGNPVESVIYFRNRINHINSGHPVCPECGNLNPEEVFQIVEAKVVNEYGRFTNQRKVSPKTWNGYFKQFVQKPAPPEDNIQPFKATSKKANWIKQVRTFIERDVKSKLNNKQYLGINLFQAPILALILTYIAYFYKSDGSYQFSDNENIPVFIFMSIIVALFLGLTVSAEEIFHDRKILKRETFLNLSRSSYLTSKVVILFFLSALQTISYVLIAKWMLEIKGLTFNYWMVLFSSACFANMLGLNISASFNSAVTIYILIPVLLIPQLILGGVVVRFDRINPSLKRDNLVPLVSDFMVSRWAFEALMVTQFRDNEYQSLFFNIEEKKKSAHYKKSYLIPRLRIKAEYCKDYLDKPDQEYKDRIAQFLNIIKNHIEEENQLASQLQFENTDRLNPEKFTKLTGDSLKSHLDQLERYYVKLYDLATKQYYERVRNFTFTKEDSKGLSKLKQEHNNESVADFVLRNNEEDRIMEGKNHLVQKIYPIFIKPKPRSLIDYRAQFYASEKHMFGKFMDTVEFNVIVIWIMTAFLYIMLYYNALTNLMNLKFVARIRKLFSRAQKNE